MIFNIKQLEPKNYIPDMEALKKEISIDNETFLKDIQSSFNAYYPYLKIEFYNHAHSQGEGSLKKNTLNSNLTIEAVQKHELSDTIKINGLTKVGDLESAFAKNFGLSVQVFRKSGKLWLQTTATDNWTLAEQNQFFNFLQIVVCKLNYKPNCFLQSTMSGV